jgi:RNA polymerase sigma-70 factor (ECF subfamily)
MARQPPDGQQSDLTPSLVARLRKGDTTTGNLLDQLYRRPLVRFCYGYLHDQQAAEDAVQEVFCRVLRASEVPDDFRAWLYRLVRNHCVSLLRAGDRRREQQVRPPPSHLADAATGNLTRLVKLETRAQMAQAVAELPEEQREVLMLRHGEGLSRAEISQVLEIPESTVKSRLFQAVNKLRAHASLLGGNLPESQAQ